MEFYTIIGPDGQKDYIEADEMLEAYTIGVAMFGLGTTVRLTWYGEWDCGTESIGSCYYDAYGVHHHKEAANV